MHYMRWRKNGDPTVIYTHPFRGHIKGVKNPYWGRYGAQARPKSLGTHARALNSARAEDPISVSPADGDAPAAKSA